MHWLVGQGQWHLVSSLMGTQSFLPTSLQRTISSRGGRHASSPEDEFGGMISHDLVRDATTTEHPLGTPEILGKGNEIINVIFT